VVGTLEYLDPEYVQGKNSEFSRDIWAIGIVAYELLVGRNPFDGMSENEKWSTILKVPPS
jgi:serine/threonine protein kinase